MAKKQFPKKKQLPEKLYAKWDGELGEVFLIAGELPNTMAEGIGETVTAGIYRLVGTVKIGLKITEE